jgi:alpha-methylacyl-CoA racemase
MSKPLDGIKIVDLTRFAPGAYCTVLLADQGADVAWLLPPNSNPMMGGIGVGLSRGKRSIAVDMRHPAGNDVLSKLCEWADVLVENNRPGELEGRGFGYRQAAAVNPRLIWCSISGFGQDGPYAMWPGHDLTYFAHSGMLNGLNPELPWHPQVVLSVAIGGAMAANGVMGALLERERTGQGTQLDISLAESTSWLLSSSDGEINGGGFGIPVGADRRLYLCGDGRYVSTAAAEPRTWSALVTGLGLDDLAAAGVPRDPEGVAAASARIEAAFATRPAAEWVAELGPKGAAIGMVNRGTDLPTDPHVVARGSLHEIGGVHVPANPIRRRTVDGPVPEDPPAALPPIGGNTREVLTEAGYSAADIEELIASGVVAVA